MVYTLYDPTTGALAQTVLKEDISNTLSNMFFLDFPLQQYLEHVPAPREYHEQPIDTFTDIARTSASVAMNAATTALDTVVKAEASTPTAPDNQFPVKVKSVVEIHAETFEVSGTARVAPTYGYVDEYTRQAWKTSKKVASDLEMRMWWGHGTTPVGGVIEDHSAATARAGGGITDNSGAPFPRQIQGLAAGAIRSMLERGSSAGVPNVGATYYDGAGNLIKSASLWGSGVAGNIGSYGYELAGQNLTRDNFRYKLMEPWWRGTGRQHLSVLFMGPKAKGQFADFATNVTGQINTRNVMASDKLITDTIDVYDTDFGRHYLNMCLYLSLPQSAVFSPTGTAADVTVLMDEVILAIIPQYFKIGVYRGLSYADLGKVGDKDAGLITAEMGLLCKNWEAASVMTNCAA